MRETVRKLCQESDTSSMYAEKRPGSDSHWSNVLVQCPGLPRSARSARCGLRLKTHMEDGSERDGPQIVSGK